MGKGNLSKRKGLLSEITHDMLDYIAEKIKGYIETKVIDKAALENEKTQREAADDALLLRIVKEEEARQTADSELEERITNAESGIKAAEDELIVSIKSEAAERESSDIRLQTELDLEAAARKTGDDTVLEILEAEQEARQTADEALRMRISEEEEARSTTDAELREVISKKVSKEDGKGLSDISGIDHMVYAVAEGTIGGNSANATELYHEFVITHQSGAEDSISVYDTEQTCAVIDEKLSSFKPSDDVDLSDYVKKEDGKGLSVYTDVLLGVYDDPNLNAEVTEIELVSATGDLGDNKFITFFTAEQTDAYIDKKLADLPSGGGSGDVDLSDYVEKEEGMLQNVSIDRYDDGTEVMTIYRWFKSIEEDAEGNQYEGDWDALPDDEHIYYTKEKIDELFAGKQDAKDISVDTGSLLLETDFGLKNNKELYIQYDVTLMNIMPSDFKQSDSFYFTFRTGDSIDITDNVGIKWFGDDCNAEGVFTPQSGTAYEVSVKHTGNGIIARVGAY